MPTPTPASPAPARLAVAVVLLGLVMSGCSQEQDPVRVAPEAPGAVSVDPAVSEPPATVSTTTSSSGNASAGRGNRLPAGLRGLLPEDDPAYGDPGDQVRFELGGRGRIDGDELVVTASGLRSRARLEDLSGVARLSRTSLQLGQAGTGYLVDDGDGEYSRLRLYLADGTGSLVRAATVGDVPLGAGFTEDGAGYVTWTTGTGSGLYTRVTKGDPSRGRYRVYRWDVPGPGEGGQEPYDDAVELVPTDVGVVCLDVAQATYERC